MAFDRHILTGGIPVVTLAGTFSIGLVGGGVGYALGLPLGVLMGALIAVGVAATLGVRIAARPVAVPQRWRFFLIPVIGVAIGAGFTPELLAEAPKWGLSLAALVLYVPLAHLIGWAIYRHLGGLPNVPAYFAAIPGGFIESLQMGEEATLGRQ